MSVRTERAQFKPFQRKQGWRHYLRWRHSPHFPYPDIKTFQMFLPSCRCHIQSYSILVLTRTSPRHLQSFHKYLDCGILCYGTVQTRRWVINFSEELAVSSFRKEDTVTKTYGLVSGLTIFSRDMLPPHSGYSVEAANFPEKLVTTCECTWYHNPEDYSPNFHRRENLKCHTYCLLCCPTY
jgi:hypothetical protein